MKFKHILPVMRLSPAALPGTGVMKRVQRFSSLFLLVTASIPAYSTTIYGGLGNFDAVNDTGVEAHGFEIELDDVTSTQIGGTYDWNHYGHPTITEDNSILNHPKVFIRYQAKYDAITGQWSAFTTFPVNGLPATQGHQCTNPAVNEGCEHFAASSYPVASSMTYSWLIDNGAHQLVRAPNSTVVATPNWVFTQPVGQPAQVVAVMPAPVVVPVIPAPVVYEFGEPSFVKVIKTQAHKANHVVLDQLIGGDKDGVPGPDWANGEEQQVESEFYLLQKGNNQNKAAHEGAAEQVNNGDNITRRYEFYKYAGNPATTIDGETHEAMCDEVGPDGLHGKKSTSADGLTGVTDANGDTQYIDCSLEVVVGDYTGANMVGFEAAAALGLIDHVEDGQINKAYVARKLVFGGNTPYSVTPSGAFPLGLTVDPVTGILTGAPTEAGLFTFTVTSTDADNTVVTKAYTINILDANGQNVVDAPAITSNGLADGVELADYYISLTATSGTAPYTWSVSPALPNGLTLSAGGILSGKPVAGTAGTTTPNFTVMDSNGKSVSKVLTLKIIAPPSITTSALANILVGSAVNLPISVTAPNNDAYTIATSALPAGLTFDNATNAIKGTPTVIGAFSIVVTATDTVTQLTATKTLSLSINDNAITFAPVLPKGVAGTPYPATSIAASGGYGAFTYAVTGGTLPTGLTLTGNTISGTPTTAGSYQFTLTATDSLLTSQQFNGSILIDAASVADFTVAVESSTLMLKRGSIVNDKVTISALSGFNKSVGFTVSGLPKNAKATFTPSTITGSGSTILKVTAASTTPVGTYKLTVTAKTTSKSSTLSHTQNITLTVQ